MLERLKKCMLSLHLVRPVFALWPETWQKILSQKYGLFSEYWTHCAICSKKCLNLAKFLGSNIILSIFFVLFFREYMVWPQQLYESGMNIEIVATASTASYGILKRLEWVATIWLQPILEDGICMFSTNTISIREFYKKETEIRSTSNTNPRYVYVFTFLLWLKQWWGIFGGAKKIII